MTVLVTGVFDVLHQEHITFLKKAKALGGKLVVGIESDARVCRLKGEGRPVNPAPVRCRQLENLAIADEVFVLPEAFDTSDDHRRLLAAMRPDILAVSSHSPHLPEKQQLLQEIGGTVVVVHEHNPAISSSVLLERRQKEHHHG